MLKKRIPKTLACVCLVVIMLVGTALTATAEDAPEEVLQAYNGVVRIINNAHDGISIGTGFIIGTEKLSYVITNYHVIEYAKTIEVLYDTKKAINASVLHEFPELDLCVLKLREEIPDGKVLSLQLANVESGMSVYALGFPFAADTVSMGYDDAMLGADTLKSDKQSLTLTNGMVSALRSSEGVGSEKQAVSIIQSNVSISSGNSGGPLLDKGGNVVGINTQISLLDDKIAVSIHVSELVYMLDILEIEYESVRDLPDTLAKQETQDKVKIVAFTIIALVSFLGAVIAIALVSIRCKKKNPVQGGISLAEFESGYQRLEPVGAFELTKNFLQEISAVARKQEIHSLFSPNNVYIGSDTIILKNKKEAAQAGKLELYPGYSAPENYRGKMKESSEVYFVGCMLYTLLTGQRPQDGLERMDAKKPLFKNSDTLLDIVNAATEPEEENRVQNLNALLQMFILNSPKVAHENSPEFGTSALDKHYFLMDNIT